MPSQDDAKSVEKHRPSYFRPLLEPLEERKLLTSVTLSHKWMDIDPTFNGTNLNPNDKVKDGVTNIIANYGTTAFGEVPMPLTPPIRRTLSGGKETIHDAVAGTSSGGGLHISDGTYAGSDFLLDRPITVFGDGANTVIVPEVAVRPSEATNLARQARARPAHQGFIVNAHKSRSAT